MKDQGELHLARVRNMACAYCSAPPPSDPHHYGPRVGRKASDFSVVPLCRRCHDQFHARRTIGMMDVPQTREWLLLRIIAILIERAEEWALEDTCPRHGIELRRCGCGS